MKLLELEQRTPAWYEWRLGRITGTRMNSALGRESVQNTLMYELIADRMAESPPPGYMSKSMMRAVEMEPFALQALRKRLNINFETAGALEHDTLKIGFSPDAIVRDEKGKIVGGAEIKCPDSKTHVKYLLADGLPAQYRYQVLGPFLLSDDIEFWYFVSFDDRNYQQPLFYKRITRQYFKEALGDDVFEKSRKALEQLSERIEENYLKLTF